MFRDHQTQIKKIVYFPAEFFLGMTVKRKLFFLLSVPQVTQRNFDFDPRAPNASSDKNLCLSHGSNHFCTTTPTINVFTVLKLTKMHTQKISRQAIGCYIPDQINPWAMADIIKYW